MWRQCSAILGKQVSITYNGCLGEQTLYHYKYSPYLLLPPDLFKEHDTIWYGTFLWSVGASCPSCVLITTMKEINCYPSQNQHNTMVHWWLSALSSDLPHPCDEWWLDSRMILPVIWDLLSMLRHCGLAPQSLLPLVMEQHLPALAAPRLLERKTVQVYPEGAPGYWKSMHHLVAFVVFSLSHLQWVAEICKIRISHSCNWGFPVACSIWESFIYRSWLSECHAGAINE